MAAALSVRDQSAADRAVALLPPCFSAGFERCWADSDLDAYGNCGELLTLYDGNPNIKPAVRARVDELPLCPAPQNHLVLIAGALGVFALGLILGTSLK